ncbi:MAG: thiamine pyrophosphate-dependent enzyme [Gammaproteobacteria bacterium]
MWAAQYYRFDQPRRWDSTLAALGTMGLPPAAMGAKSGFRILDAACVTGEGSIQMM